MTGAATRGAQAWAALGLVAAVVLAGCGDDGPTVVEVAPGQVVEVPEPPSPTRGIVSGIVGDDALYPLPGVDLYVLGTDLKATTDGNGRFAILDVEPGLYILEGRKKDHADTQTTVEVRAGEVAKAVLLLPRLPPTDPYHTTWREEAFVEAWGAFVSAGERNTTLEVTLDPSTPRTLVLEASWEGTFVSRDDTPFDWRLSQAGREVLAGEAQPTFTVRVDARVLDRDRERLAFAVAPRVPDVVVLQASGDLFATVFYNAEAPPGWSMLGDA